MEFHFPLSSMMLLGDEDDEKKDEPKGGPEAGDYTPPVEIPDGSDALDNSQQ